MEVVDDNEKLKKDQLSVGWACRFHPTEWFHEVGCPHMEWTKEQLLSALIVRKKFEQESYTR